MITQHRQRIILPLLLYLCFKHYTQNRYDINAPILKSEYALKRRKKKRMLWSVVNEQISEAHFRQMFRMIQPCFNLLCATIITSIGERAFFSIRSIYFSFS